MFITAIVTFVFAKMREEPNLAQAAVALGTLTLAIVTAYSIDANRQQEERRMRLALLNTVATWAADVRKYCARLIGGFNTEEERSEAADKYLALKFDGKRLLAMVEKEDWASKLSDVMREATCLFDGLSWRDLVGNRDKLKDSDAKSETVIEEAINLIKAQ